MMLPKTTLISQIKVRLKNKGISTTGGSIAKAALERTGKHLFMSRDMKTKSISKSLLYLCFKEEKAYMLIQTIGCNVSNLMRRKRKRQNSRKMNQRRNQRPNKLK